MSLFKKALSIFVELDETTPNNASAPQTTGNTPPPVQQTPAQQQVAPSASIQQADLGKFVKHFEQLFDNANLPGPDYYEFWKMMDTLESHIPDENARIQAVFATLSMQGLNKAGLIDSAGTYKAEILRDKSNFEAAVQQKADAEISGRRNSIQQLEAEAAQKQQQIAQMQKEIEASGKKIAQLQQEIAAEETKIASSQQGYLAACNAMMSKIENDVQRFQQQLK
jgi:chromosome segregation ATPase